MSPRAKSKAAEAEPETILQDSSALEEATESSPPKARSTRKTTRKTSSKTSKTSSKDDAEASEEAQASSDTSKAEASSDTADDKTASDSKADTPPKKRTRKSTKTAKASSDDDAEEVSAKSSNDEAGNTEAGNAEASDKKADDTEADVRQEARDNSDDNNDKAEDAEASEQNTADKPTGNSNRKRRSSSKSRGGSDSGRNSRNSKSRKSRKARASNDDGDTDGDDDSSGSRRGRNKRRNGQRSQLNYRDLQTKIIPELHLLAKEVGLEDFRSMSKDDLAKAILERSAESDGLKLVSGFLEISSDGYGFLQESMLQNNTRSVIVSAGLIKQFKLRTGDYILGKSRRPRENERYGTLIRVEAVNNSDPFLVAKRPRFDDLVPTFPEQRIRLETTQSEVATRVIDLLAPIGRGQRGLIVAPPKAGKTTLLKKVANAVVANVPDIKVIVLLVDERPEEVTDFRESVEGVEVVASTFDEPPTNHIRVAEFVHERARRIVEDGGHVMILLDSITRLARANNLVTPPTGRTLSGGLDSSALHWPKRFLGAARNIRGGGSLSILATALVETGSRMDDVIFEEFKGTGNMELHLSRRLEERRIFPALDILKSSTRREDLLLGEETLAKMWLLRKVISDMDSAEAMDMLLSRLSRTTSNEEFLSTLTQG